MKKCEKMLETAESMSSIVIPLCNNLLMLMKTASRIKTAVKDMLAVLDSSTVSAAELRDALAEMKAVPALVSAFQVCAAEMIAEHEGHGDDGAAVLAVGAGLSNQDARRQVKTAKTLKRMPKVRDAIQEGRIPVANVRQLVGAAGKTSRQDVDSDNELLAKAESLQPEQFSREARRWIVEQQNDHGEADYKRQRAKRYVKVWDGADGMVHLHGLFDSVTGRRIGNRLRNTARHLYNTGKKNTNSNSDRRNSGVHNGNSSWHIGSTRNSTEHNGSIRNDDLRTFDQCMADALDNLTTNTTNSSTVQLFGGGQPFVGAAATNPVDATNPNTTNSSTVQLFGGAGNPVSGSSTGHLFGGAVTKNPSGTAGSVAVDCVAGRPFADIAVVAHVDDRTGGLVAEIAGGDPLPPSVLDELACNASIVGMLYNTKGIPLWQGYTKRTATAGQLKALIARYGGCFACGANPAMCQAHHIKPWSKGGPTNIDNMVLVCWQCHQKIHRHNWQIITHNGQHTLHPSNHTFRQPNITRTHLPVQPGTTRTHHPYTQPVITCEPQDRYTPAKTATLRVTTGRATDFSR
ncbi:MAG: DUF222 domain-containing protein [Acidimicrobiaceae bacterium]|nr:DUF222 domain-containing protein [Acidimicrobiaceae bacterium]MDE0268481.1 DUF222 domain-containing protein [Acidimicrobiaceae bacterium]